MKGCFFKVFIVLCLNCTILELSAKNLDSRVHLYHGGIKNIIPTHVKCQYGGGNGLIYVGCGWDYGEKCRWETDCCVGILPKAFADKTHITFTLKQNYIPWSISFFTSDRVFIEPLSCLASVGLISGEEFWGREPSKYGGKYYNFATRVRLGLGVGQRLVYNIRDKHSAIKSFTLYYELLVNDLDFLAFVTNKSIKLSDIITFSAGIKVQIFRNCFEF